MTSTVSAHPCLAEETIGRIRRTLENINNATGLEWTGDITVNFVDTTITVAFGNFKDTSLVVDLRDVCNDQVRGGNLVADYMLGRISKLVQTEIETKKQFGDSIHRINDSIRIVMDSLISAAKAGKNNV